MYVLVHQECLFDCVATEQDSSVDSPLTVCLGGLPRPRGELLCFSLLIFFAEIVNKGYDE